jgi:predicted metal-binding membrane protein
MTETALSVEQPRSAFYVLQRRITIGIVAVLLVLAGVSWWNTVGNSRDMSSMVQGIAQVGRDMPFDMSIGLFLSMWVAMMSAMMLPTIAPIVLLHRSVARRRGEGATPTVAFVGGYLIVWALIGLIPLAALIGFRHIAETSTWVARAGGGVLVLAGLYQFTPWKTACLKACRSPLSFLMTHDFGSGPGGALRVGLSHGAYCLGCCWALMAVLFVVGLMNLGWMAGIAIVFLAEKNWRRGVGLTYVVGAAVALLGIAIIAHPAWLSTVAHTTMNAGEPGMMMGG